MDQYCNPLSDVSLSSISGLLDEIVEKVRRMLSIKNPSHPSLRVTQGAFEKGFQELPTSVRRWTE